MDAINYALNQWQAMTTFLNDAAVPLDNNISEREMKRVAINRDYVQRRIMCSPVTDGARAGIFID